MSLTGLACGQIDQLHEEAGDILTALVETFPKRSLAVPVWKPPPPRPLPVPTGSQDRGAARCTAAACPAQS